jgi:hypothetical protein
VEAKHSCFSSPSSTSETCHWKQCCLSEVTQQCHCNKVVPQIAVKFHIYLLANVERRSSPAYVLRVLVGSTKQNVLHLPYSVRYITSHMNFQHRNTWLCNWHKLFELTIIWTFCYFSMYVQYNYTILNELQPDKTPGWVSGQCTHLSSHVEMS